jgi:hypothetical protein
MQRDRGEFALTFATLACLVGVMSLAALPGCSDSPSESDSDTFCRVEELEDGTITIVCPDSSVDIEPCYAGLADLDGSSRSDEGDCALAGAGALQRQLCDSWGAWSTLPGCRAETRAELTRSAAQSREIAAAFDPSDRILTAAYADGGALRYWRDLDADLQTVGELQDLPTNDGIVLNSGPSLDFTDGGCATVLHSNLASSVVDLWIDRDCNKQFVLAEHVRLTFSANELANVRLLNNRDRIDLLYTRYTPMGVSIEAWRDLNSDGVRSADEVLPVASGVLSSGPIQHKHSIGIRNSVLYTTADGRSWEWQAGAAWTSSAATTSERASTLGECAAVADVDFSTVLCDRSLISRGGIHIADFDVRGRPHDISTEYGGAFTGSASNWVIFNGIDFNQPTGVTFAQYEWWTNSLGNSAFRESALLGLFYRGSPLFFTVASNVLSLEYWHPRERSLFLGEPCALGPLDCVANYVCRISGSDPDPRCVPPPP